MCSGIFSVKLQFVKKNIDRTFPLRWYNFKKPIQLSSVAKHKLVDGKGVIVELMAELGLKIR